MRRIMSKWHFRFSEFITMASSNQCLDPSSLYHTAERNSTFFPICTYSFNGNRTKVGNSTIVIEYHENAVITSYAPMCMVTSPNGNIFRVTGPLWGESSGHRWIPLTKASDAELWCFIWSAPEQRAEQTPETPVIWDAITLIMKSL